MAKKKEVGEHRRMRIVTTHKEGKGYKAVSKQFLVPVCMVQYLYSKEV